MINLGMVNYCYYTSDGNRYNLYYDGDIIEDLEKIIKLQDRVVACVYVYKILEDDEMTPVKGDVPQENKSSEISV